MSTSRLFSATGSGSDTAFRTVWVTQLVGRNQTREVEVLIGDCRARLTLQEAFTLGAAVITAAHGNLEAIPDTDHVT